MRKTRRMSEKKSELTSARCEKLSAFCAKCFFALTHAYWLSRSYVLFIPLIHLILISILACREKLTILFAFCCVINGHVIEWNGTFRSSVFGEGFQRFSLGVCSIFSANSQGHDTSGPLYDLSDCLCSLNVLSIEPAIEFLLKRNSLDVSFLKLISGQAINK